jgi:prophage maintenance system killer protein
MRTYVEGANVDKALVDFVSWYETAAAGNMHTVELAAQAYQRLISIHPFWDANGRTCRMVMDWILQKQGLPPAVLDDVNVAVFGGHVLYNQMDQVVSASKAAEAVAAGVERSLMQLQAAAK